METNETTHAPILEHRPWNKGKLIGQKPPLQPKHVWAIRSRLQLANKKRDLALFNVAIDSKLRGCDVDQLESRRYCSAWLCTRPGDRPAEEDRSACSVRADRADAASR